jgi:hypothetical protein
VEDCAISPSSTGSRRASRAQPPAQHHMAQEVAAGLRVTR